VTSNYQISHRGEDSGLGSIRRMDILGSMRTHIALALFLFLAIGGGAGYLVYVTDSPSYLATGEIHVDRMYQKTLETDRELDLANSRDYDIFRSEQVALLLTPAVLLDALERSGQYDSAYWATEGRAEREIVEDLERSFVIEAIPSSYRIRIELYASNPEIPTPLLSALMESFIEAHRSKFFFAEDRRPEIVRELLGTSNELIKIKRGELRDLSNQLQVLDFARAPRNPWEEELRDARRDLNQTLREESERQLEHDTLLAALENEENLLVLLAQGGTTADTSPLAQALSNLVMERHEAEASMEAMGPEHPGRDEAVSRLKKIQPRIQEAMQRFSSARVAESSRVLDLAKSRASSLDIDARRLTEQSSEYVRLYQRGIDLEREIADELPHNHRLRDRLAFFELEAQSLGFVSVSREASEVDPNGESKLMRNLVVALFFALVIAVGIPFLIDILDKKVHTTRDVELALGIPPAAWFPRSSARSTETKRMFAANQVRRLAMLMDNEDRRFSPHATLFTEVRPGEGMPQLVAECAQMLSEIGRRVLVIDARPTLKSAENKGAPLRGNGFRGLLAGDGLSPESRGAWDYLPYGDASHGHATSLSSWNRVVRDSCKDYEMVLIVVPPLLISPEAEYMVASADLVLVVAEAEKQTLGELRRAGEILARLRPAAVGSVLNRVRVFRNRGHYKQMLKDTRWTA
jgi:polysaccharide biosynthesis transport protein